MRQINFLALFGIANHNTNKRAKIKKNTSFAGRTLSIILSNSMPKRAKEINKNRN